MGQYIADFRLVFSAARIVNQKSAIGNHKTHPLPRDGTNCASQSGEQVVTLQRDLTREGSLNYLSRRSSLRQSAKSGRNSMVECQLPKLKVASSSLVARSRFP